MKKRMLATMMALMLMSGAQAMAEDWNWVNSRFHGPVRLASYADGFDGYQCADGFGGVTAADPYFVTVISKAASIWAEPRTGSKKLASASNGDIIPCRSTADGMDNWKENGFYAVDYNGKAGWVNEDYVISNTLEITLMQSNVPAYIAPDVHSKKVGSLSKMTKLRVIGFYDDFYIVELRGAAAYIPMDVRHYDTKFEGLYRTGVSKKGKTMIKTPLRTGPGEEYPEIKELPSGYEVDCMDEINGYYVVINAEDLCYAFVNMQDVQTGE